jgi:hypothetical protein
MGDVVVADCERFAIRPHSSRMSVAGEVYRGEANNQLADREHLAPKSTFEVDDALDKFAARVGKLGTGVGEFEHVSVETRDVVVVFG